MALRNPFKQSKKNRLRALWETAGLALSNRLSRARVVADGGPVVTLTSWGRRIATVHSTVESIGRGRLKPSRIVLWLGEREAREPLPPPLRRLVARGLEVRYAHDEGPHTKYYPQVAAETAFDRPLVTADDDIFYPRDWLLGLVRAHEERPDLIHAWRAKCVRLRDGALAPSREWGMCSSTEPHACHFATGVSGVIYPPSFLRHLKRVGTAFRDCSPRDDDLWLHVQALRSGHRVAQVGPVPVHFVGRLGTQEQALHRINVKGGGTDRNVPLSYRDEDLAVLREADRRRCAGCTAAD